MSHNHNMLSLVCIVPMVAGPMIMMAAGVRSARAATLRPVATDMVRIEHYNDPTPNAPRSRSTMGIWMK
jgi:hypothetical protein